MKCTRYLFSPLSVHEVKLRWGENHWNVAEDFFSLKALSLLYLTHSSVCHLIHSLCLWVFYLFVRQQHSGLIYNIFTIHSLHHLSVNITKYNLIHLKLSQDNRSYIRTGEEPIFDEEYATESVNQGKEGRGQLLKPIQRNSSYFVHLYSLILYIQHLHTFFCFK